MRAFSLVALTAIAELLLAGSTSAHIGKGVLDRKRGAQMDQHHHHKRLHKSPTRVKRSATSVEPSDEPSGATSTNAAQECSPYNVEAVTKLTKSFPTIWDTAKIVAGDTAATSVWNRIQKSGIIPTSVKQKGTGGTGNFDNVKYDTNKDPDCWWTDTNCVTPKHKGIPDDIWQCAEPETWGLTFDDGPNCSHNAFYDFLQSQNQKATLFYIGSNVMDWPLEAERGIVDGHHVCVHTWSHQYMTQLTDEEVFAELYYTAKAIKEIAGITPRCWRPPYGDVDDRVRAIATGLGMSTNIWSQDTNDWEIAPEGNQPKSKIDANYASIIGLDYQQHGNIVLTHEIDAGTMNEMIQQYPNIKAKFKNIVPLTACMNETNPYPENITYPNFQEYVAGNVLPLGLPSGSAIKPTVATYLPQAYASQSTLSQTLPNTVAAANAAVATATKASSQDSSSSAAASNASITSHWMLYTVAFFCILSAFSYSH